MSGTFSTEHRTPFISALVEFLMRQPLRELNVLYWEGVPPTTILRLLTAAPMVSFFSVYVNRDPLHPSDHLQLTPKLEELFVGYGARGIYELLAQPQFELCASTLRRLSVDYLHSGSVSPLAQFVSDIQFIPPEFPLLCFVEASLWFRDITTPWFSETISLLASTSAILADISISFFPLNHEDVAHAIIPDGVMAALDVAIAAHPGRPVIRWRFDFPAYFDDETRNECQNRLALTCGFGTIPIEFLPQELVQAIARVDAEGDNLEQSIQQMIDKPVNVHQRILTFCFLRYIPASLFDFLARQPLRKVSVSQSDGVSAASILHLLTAAPVVSFMDVFVESDPFPLENPQYNPKVEELLIGSVNSTSS
ncbi:hypothetical protein MSAN_02084700 [Mycena sanguinolenta]|uniref:Uncharacterized protein n=1 Tax=Mycena sanguinolenta TaxID=230812 RepID=A0A8H7CMR7_9AGAR|nr:hypothetical protein MSAN_02084700 [Mycena sanguinolenta]